MSNIKKYINNIEKLIKAVSTKEADNIENAALAAVETLKAGKWIYAFGTGHSHILAEEIFYRAGGLVKIYPILNTELMLHEGAVKSTSMERLSGYAKVILDDYPIEKGDLLFIFSNSGRNAVPIEMAIEAKKRNIKTIALTNIAHSSASKSRHVSGKRLFELVDIVIDNCGIHGDACISTKTSKVAPTSTVIGAMIMNAIVARTAELLEEKKIKNIELYSSSNTDAGEKLNMKFIHKYKNIIKPL
jgi:uncharacterized phosphosugar-binding protein